MYSQELIFGSVRINVRGLKHKEVRQLRQAGYHMTNIPHEKISDFMDEVIKFGVEPKDHSLADDLFESDYHTLFKTIMGLTYPPEEEKKTTE